MGYASEELEKTKLDAHTGYICKNMVIDERSTCALTCFGENGYKHQVSFCEKIRKDKVQICTVPVFQLPRLLHNFVVQPLEL